MWSRDLLLFSKNYFRLPGISALEHILRYTTLALLDVPGSTVLGLPNAIANSIPAASSRPNSRSIGKKFWTTEFSSWNEQFAGEAITPIINKMGQFVANPIIRNIVGQTKSSIKIDEIINNEKILIANFSIGKLGEENSALFGSDVRYQVVASGSSQSHPYRSMNGKILTYI